MHDEGSLCFAVAFKSEKFVYHGCQSTDDTGSVGRTSLANRTFTTKGVIDLPLSEEELALPVAE